MLSRKKAGDLLSKLLTILMLPGQLIWMSFIYILLHLNVAGDIQSYYNLVCYTWQGFKCKAVAATFFACYFQLW
jgi:hypothetical protein